MTSASNLTAASPADCDAIAESQTMRGLHFIDLHTHSRYSDGLASLEQIEDHCLRREMAVSLTDHNEIRGSVELRNRGRIPCLAGIEVGSYEGLEFLVYFQDPARLEDYYRRAVEPGLLTRFMVRSRIGSVECLDVAREMGAFVSLAHPFAFGRKSLEFQKRSPKTAASFVDDVLSRVDAVEYFNGGVPAGVNRKAAAFIDQLGKPITVGSDSHRLKTFGSCGLFFEHEHDLEESLRNPCMFSVLTNGTVTDHAASQASITLLLPVIMLKHTLFFVKAGNHPRHRAR